jgi:hypothetical protein
MAFVPNINSLRSNFAMRGDFLRNDFATRYGGGNFVAPTQEPVYATGFSGIAGSAQASQMFRSDAGDMVRKVVKTDTKTLNNQIASSLGDTVQDEVQTSSRSYSKPSDTVVTQTMMPDQFNDFVSRVQKNESNEQDLSKKTTNQAITEDSGVRNVAAALRTTEDNTMNQIENPATSQKFSNTVDSIFGKNQDAPKDYKMTKMDITYTKIDPPEDDFDDIDSVNVTGRVVDDKAPQNKSRSNPAASNMTYSDDPWERFKALYMDFYGAGVGSTLNEPETSDEDDDYDEIESVDVTGNVGKIEDDDYDEIESVDVIGKMSNRPVTTSTASLAAPPPPPAPVIEPEFTPQDTTPAVTEYNDSSDIVRNTNDILRASDENASLTDLSSILAMLEEQKKVEAQPPVIINNNRTITATPPDEPRTDRVFSNDSTFNRLSFADSDFPRSFGGFF